MKAIVYRRHDEPGEVLALGRQSTRCNAQKERKFLMYVVFGVTGNTGKVVADSLLAQKKAAESAPRRGRGCDGERRKGARVGLMGA